jgi:hypothetical protein
MRKNLVVMISATEIGSIAQWTTSDLVRLENQITARCDRLGVERCRISRWRGYGILSLYLMVGLQIYQRTRTVLPGISTTMIYFKAPTYYHGSKVFARLSRLEWELGKWMLASTCCSAEMGTISAIFNQGPMPLIT